MSTARNAAIASHELGASVACTGASTPGTSARDSDAAITTAARAGCGRSFSRPGNRDEHQDDRRRADQARDLALRAGLHGDGGPGARWC